MKDLHDVSTARGFLSQIWFRWKYPLLLTIGAVALIFGLSYVLESYGVLGSSSPIPESTFVLLGSTLYYHGNESKFDDRYLDHFPDLPLPSEYPLGIETIEIKFVRIHGPDFSAQLSNYSSSLKTLRLNNITIEDHLQPVSLPHLKEFFLVQGLQPEERNAPDYILNRGPTPWLSSTLFFLNDSTSDFDSKAVAAYQKGINVTVYLKGSVTYQLNPAFHELRLDISNCSGVLGKLPRQSYKILTLGRCKDLTETIIDPEIVFLNFYIVYVSNEQLSGILRRLKVLEELYAEIPDGPIDIRLEDLPESLRLLSVSSMTIIPSRNSSLPNIKEFYFGAENQYGWLDTRVTKLNESLFLDFARFFPNVEKVGLFDLSDENRYVFLNSVMKSNSVKWIIVENFGRGRNISHWAKDDQAFEYVEKELDALGLRDDDVDFLLSNDNITGIRSGRTITKEEKLWYRYTLLGWCPIDSWAKYLYVQRIIEGGGLLL